jgi:hypothetical protein
MKPAKVVDIVRAIPAREVRSTVINWRRIVETVIDGYRSRRGSFMESRRTEFKMGGM